MAYAVPRRLRLEVIGVLITVLVTSVGFYLMAGPFIRQDERSVIALELGDALALQGVEIPDIQTKVTEGSFAKAVAVAVAEVRDVRNTFSMATGDAVQIADGEHVVLYLGARFRQQTLGWYLLRIDGEDVWTQPGRSHVLPRPSQNCRLQTIRLNDHRQIASGEVPDEGVFKIACPHYFD